MFSSYRGELTIRSWEVKVDLKPPCTLLSVQLYSKISYVNYNYQTFTLKICLNMTCITVDCGYCFRIFSTPWNVEPADNTESSAEQ